MRENYSIDALVDYSTENIPESTRVVCPLYREADRDVRNMAAQLARKKCQCNEIILCDEIAPDKVIAYEEQKQALLEEIRDMEATLTELKECRRNTPQACDVCRLAAGRPIQAVGHEKQILYRCR